MKHYASEMQVLYLSFMFHLNLSCRQSETAIYTVAPEAASPSGWRLWPVQAPGIQPWWTTVSLGTTINCPYVCPGIF